MTNDAMDGRWFDRQFPLNASLVILHPNFTRQHLFLPVILGQQDRTPIFLSARRSGTDSEGLWDLLQSALADQFELPLPAYNANASKAAQTLLKTLKPIEPYILIVENVDLLDEQSTCPFLVALIAGLSTNTQIVLAGRKFPTVLMEYSEV